MALNFPSAPNIDDTWLAYTGVTYIWDGVKWDVLVAQPAAYIPISGGVMTGPLILYADPSEPLGAATKQYADVNGGGGGGQVIVDGVSIVGDGAIGGTPLSVDRVDGARYTTTLSEAWDAGNLARSYRTARINHLRKGPT